MSSRKRERGFTLTEIIVAVAVVAVLAGAMTPLIFKQIERSKTARARQDMDAVKTAFVQYYADTQFWPCGWNAASSKAVHKDFTAFSCLYTDDKKPGWDGPYINESGGKKKGKPVVAVKNKQGEWNGVTDPWGQPYRIYEAHQKTKGTTHGAIILYSKGKNGKVDTKPKDLLVADAKKDDIAMLLTSRAVN